MAEAEFKFSPPASTVPAVAAACPVTTIFPSPAKPLPAMGLWELVRGPRGLGGGPHGPGVRRGLLPCAVHIEDTVHRSTHARHLHHCSLGVRLRLLSEPPSARRPVGVAVIPRRRGVWRPLVCWGHTAQATGWSGLACPCLPTAQGSGARSVRPEVGWGRSLPARLPQPSHPISESSEAVMGGRVEASQ